MNRSKEIASARTPRKDGIIDRFFRIEIIFADFRMTEIKRGWM
jgi:hypothetical protein